MDLATGRGDASLRTTDAADIPKAVRDLLTKARTSWLKNTEVLDLLSNYRRYNFNLNKVTPTRPCGEHSALRSRYSMSTCGPGGSQDVIYILL